MYKIVCRKQLSEAVFQMEIMAPLVAAKAQAGQFVILRTDKDGERVPFTIMDSNKSSGTVSIIVQEVGYTTKQLGAMSAGDSIEDVVGPLGMPTDIAGVKKACVIGGGVGCAIAYPAAKALFNRGAQVDVIAGFRDKSLVILEEEFKAVSQNVYITTDDGSYGIKGFVTNKLAALIEAGADYDLVIAIGPVPMMKFVCAVTKPYGIKTTVSLNPIMIDGTGMCGGCRVNVGGKIRFACVDGPDFDGHLVDFDELMQRNGIYKAEEQAHLCRLQLEGDRQNG